MPGRSLLPGRGKPCAALVATVATPAGPVRVVVTHLGLMPEARARQAGALADLLAADPRVPTLLLADLNAEPEALELRPLSGLLRPLASPPTFPASGPYRRPDAVYASAHWAPVAVWVDPEPVSDHLALLARLAWAPPAAGGP